MESVVNFIGLLAMTVIFGCLMFKLYENIIMQRIPDGVAVKIDVWSSALVLYPCVAYALYLAWSYQIA